MERRRRALGLRKVISDSEEKIVKPLENISDSLNRKNKPKLPRAMGVDESAPGNEEFQSSKAGSVTPKHCTPKRNDNAFSNQTDSPGSPLQSPGYQSMFPRTFSSPEIEVSWDWGCSQVLTDVLPPRRSKRKSQSHPALMSVPAAMAFPRLPLCHKLMSEEENQEILTFYKNVLSKSSKGCSEESIDLKNNNSEKEASSIATTVNTTPKCSLKSSGESEKVQEQSNSYFDDSANEFMLECSQAIEEKLKNGEIDMGPIVNIKIESRKHPHSPVLKPENVIKKVCHGGPKHNLFPESPKNVKKSMNDITHENIHRSLRSPQNKKIFTKACATVKNTPLISTKSESENNNNVFLKTTHNAPLKKLVSNSEIPSSSSVANGGINTKKYLLHTESSGVKDELTNKFTVRSVNTSNHELLDRRPLLVRQGQTTNNNTVNSGVHNTPASNIIKPAQKVVNAASYDSVDKFRRVQTRKPSAVDVQSGSKPLMGNKTVIDKPLCNQISRHASIDEIKNNSGHENITHPQGLKPKADFSHLLDDGLDMELSNLDFDSLCCSSQPVKPEAQLKRTTVSKPTQKLCSQQEIEAKRIAARNKLMMKKRR